MGDVAQVVGFSFGALCAFAALAGLIWLLLLLYQALVFKFCEVRNLTRHVRFSMEREFEAKLEGEDYWDGYND